jgi:hypothetical protein
MRFRECPRDHKGNTFAYLLKCPLGGINPRSPQEAACATFQRASVSHYSRRRARVGLWSNSKDARCKTAANCLDE